MTNEHYLAVIEDLERKRAEIDAALAVMRRMAGLATDEHVSLNDIAAFGVALTGGSRGKMREDEFFGMSIVKAAKKYLSIVRQPTPAPVIARELKAHGLLNTSKGFSGTVYSLLYRESEKPNATVIKMADNKWALAEWYPNRPKPRVKGENGSEPTPDEPPTEPGQPS